MRKDLINIFNLKKNKEKILVQVCDEAVKS